VVEAGRQGKQQPEEQVAARKLASVGPLLAAFVVGTREQLVGKRAQLVVVELPLAQLLGNIVGTGRGPCMP
jgi:hypothetical protein